MAKREAQSKSISKDLVRDNCSLSWEIFFFFFCDSIFIPVLAHHNCSKCLTGSMEEEEKLIFTHGFGGHRASCVVPIALRPVVGVNYLDMKEC